MKYAVFFFLVCVAVASAAPQYVTAWNGVVGGVVPGGVFPGYGTRTLVQGPTVVNGGVVPGVVPGRVVTTGLYGGGVYV